MKLKIDRCIVLHAVLVLILENHRSLSSCIGIANQPSEIFTSPLEAGIVLDGRHAWPVESLVTDCVLDEASSVDDVDFSLHPSSLICTF